MADNFQKFQRQVEGLQENIDSYGLGNKSISAQEFDGCEKEILQLEKTLDSFRSSREHSAISYRLQIQHYKGLLNQLRENLRSLKPQLNIPLDKPVSLDELHGFYVQAQKYFQKNDAYEMAKEAFITTVKQARLKARKYYEGAKTQVSVCLDEKGPYIKIQRRA